MTALDTDGLVERLRERISRIEGFIASSQRVVTLLQPEMDKFDARTGHDIYTVRMAVDHQSGIRAQSKEVDELVEAVDLIERQAAEIARLREALENIADRDKLREWTATSDNPETHWVTRDGAYAIIARASLKETTYDR